MSTPVVAAPDGTRPSVGAGSAQDAVRHAVAGDEHAVGARRLRQQQRTTTPRLPRAVRLGQRLQLGVVHRDVLVDPPALGGAQGAHAVDEHSPGPHQLDRGIDEPALQLGEAWNRVSIEPPAGVGTSTQHAEPRARRVEQHPVGATRAERRVRRIGDHDRDDALGRRAARRCGGSARPVGAGGPQRPRRAPRRPSPWPCHPARRTGRATDLARRTHRPAPRPSGSRGPGCSRPPAPSRWPARSSPPALRRRPRRPGPSRSSSTTQSGYDSSVASSG